MTFKNEWLLSKSLPIRCHINPNLLLQLLKNEACILGGIQHVRSVLFFLTCQPHSILASRWEIAGVCLLLGPSLICLPAFSSHCLSCSHLTHHYTSSEIPESFGWGSCDCGSVCGGHGPPQKPLFLFLLVREWMALQKGDSKAGAPLPSSKDLQLQNLFSHDLALTQTKIKAGITLNRSESEEKNVVHCM